MVEFEEVVDAVERSGNAAAVGSTVITDVSERIEVTGSIDVKVVL